MGAAIGTLLATAGTALASAWASATAAAASAGVYLGLVAETAVWTTEIFTLDAVGSALLATGVPTYGTFVASGLAADAITYTITGLGASVLGLIASGAILGASYGILQLALNSGRAIAAPTQPSANDILNNKLPCTILDFLNDNLVQCRKRKGLQMRMGNRKKDNGPMHDPEEEVLLSGNPKSVSNPKRRSSKSPRVGQKVNRVRRGQSSK